jgi:arylsulfatase A-like enzyme
MRMGMTAYLGPLRTRREQLDYVNFYAYLHSVVDRKIGRILSALGSADDPESLRSRTVVVRTSDHGEMGLAHGGLRQKAFNAYEETINVPLVVSNPLMFPEARETASLASLVDILPTMLSLAGHFVPGDLRGRDLSPVLADPSVSVQEAVHFTYDDHQAATATQEAPGQPNRVRAIRTADAKYAFYFDPAGRARTEYELYDLADDPLETNNLLGVRTAEPASSRASSLRDEMVERLSASMAHCGTAPQS